uniref:Uncharacterized protein n=1 Tax=Siphoviridae sp. ctBLh2 TaxID=2827803 RepID=A0A8S5S3V0_9CAUD|nr:MAG TPA: hypothetical protein [Siphoviridae sp. ctBLh2]
MPVDGQAPRRMISGAGERLKRPFAGARSCLSRVSEGSEVPLFSRLLRAPCFFLVEKLPLLLQESIKISYF